MKKLFLLLFLPLTLFAAVNSNGDRQIWNRDGLTIRLSPKSAFYGELEFRYGDDASKLYYKHVHTQLDWSFNPWITLSPGVRRVWYLVDNKWKHETDPLVILNLTFLKSSRFVIDDRNWVQFRNLPSSLGGKTRTLYRNRFRLLFPLGRLSPYVFDELFYQETRGVFENRATIGTFLRRTERAFFDFFFTYRSLKRQNDLWVTNYVFGLSAYFNF